ncbi:MAG: hypothetical protein J6K55_02910 [Clostridia bacterium]|nr:hypothetical protein [Clostridia bacterium]
MIACVAGSIANVAYGTSQLITTAIIALTGEINVTAKFCISNIVYAISLAGTA